MNRRLEFNLKNIAYYFLGFFIVGLGVVLMLRADLGAGPWDTVSANLEKFIDKFLFDVTLGMMSFTIASILMLIVLFYTKKWYLIGMVVPIFVVAVSLDFWNSVGLANFNPENMFIRLGASIIGGIFIPLGLSFIIASNFPAFVFDELTIMLMEIFRTESVTIVRAGLETTGILLGLLFGFLAGIDFGAVGVASIILVFMLPPLLEFFLKRLGVLNEKDRT